MLPSATEISNRNPCAAVQPHREALLSQLKTSVPLHCSRDDLTDRILLRLNPILFNQPYREIISTTRSFKLIRKDKDDTKESTRRKHLAIQILRNRGEWMSTRAMAEHRRASIRNPRANTRLCKYNTQVISGPSVWLILGRRDNRIALGLPTSGYSVRTL